MKRKSTIAIVAKVLLIFAVLNIAEFAYATDSVYVKPTYSLKVSGQNVPAQNEFVFEIRIKHTNPTQTVYNYAGAQYFFNFNNTIANGGTLAYGYVSGSGDLSDLPVNFRPRNPQIFDNGNGTSQLRLAVNTFPGPRNGYLIPNYLNGIKVCKMKISTTSTSFSQGSEIGLIWRDSLPGPFTKIFAYTLSGDTINTDITNRSWHSIDPFPYNCPTSWSQSLRINDAGNVNDSLKFGMSQNGTVGIDPCLGEVVIPPLPPTGIFDCRFVLPSNEAVKNDFRRDSLGSTIWRMTFQPSVSGYPITFNWNIASFPATGGFFLKDEITGTLVNVNMRNQSSYTLTTSGITSLKIEYNNITLASSVTSGWNIVSVPVRTSDMLYSTLFPGVASQAYAYSNGYVSIAMLSNGTGYWMKFNNAANFNYTGYPWTPENMIVSPGWNLIGPFDNNIPISSIMSNPAGIVTSNYFGYNGGYYNPDTLKVGRGYWIRTSTAGYIYQGSADNNPNAITTNPLEDFVEVRFTNGDENSTALYLGNASEMTIDYSMPPVPPSGIFDVRFATDKFVEELGKIHSLKLNSATGQTRITLHNARGLKMKIKDAIDGTIISKEIEEGTEVIIPANLENLVLETNGIIPKTYELSQNYPNPFNPVTTIKYQIPDDGLVKLIVFDVLGREVKTLVNSVQTAGVYEVRFDASSVASGVYFYRMTSGNFEDLKKLVVLK
jgi:hypothetical protein